MVRDIVVRPIDLDRSRLTRLCGIRAIQIAAKLIEREETDILIDLLLGLRAEEETRLGLLLASCSGIGEGATRHVAQLDIGLLIELAVHVVGLPTLEVEVCPHNRHDRHVGLSDALSTFARTDSVDVRRGIARGGLGVDRARSLREDHLIAGA